jgi:NADPH:quinone reductase-like Zn-dependent oxidoreductase
MASTAHEGEKMTTMHAVRLLPPGGIDNLAIEQIDVPKRGTGEALVRVRAAGITRDELDWPTDRLPAIPSYELSGVIEELGPDVEGLAAGDAVWALTPFDRDGVACELTVVPAALLAPRPAALDDVAAAATPLPALSAWQALFDHGRLEAGQRVLVHGAAGGVGHLAVQIALARGAQVVGTSSAAGVDLVRELGAEVVDTGSERFEDVEPVDLVFDTAGGELLARSPAVLKQGGRIVTVAEEPPAGVVASGVEAIYFIVEPNRDELVEIGRLIDAGQVRPAIDAVFPLGDARAAFERSLAHGKRGKVVLEVSRR